MAIYSCRYCVAPRRHPGCHGTCPDYLKEKAANDEVKEKRNRENRIQADISAVRTHNFRE